MATRQPFFPYPLRYGMLLPTTDANTNLLVSMKPSYSCITATDMTLNQSMKNNRHAWHADMDCSSPELKIARRIFYSS